MENRKDIFTKEDMEREFDIICRPPTGDKELKRIKAQYLILLEFTTFVKNRRNSFFRYAEEALMKVKLLD